jgi:hypothetical protein
VWRIVVAESRRRRRRTDSNDGILDSDQSKRRDRWAATFPLALAKARSERPSEKCQPAERVTAWTYM